MRLVLWVTILGWLGLPLQAVAQAQSDRLVIPYQLISQFYEQDQEHNLTGFSVEVAKRVAELAGFEVGFQRLPKDVSPTLMAMDPGTDMSVGLPNFPGLETSQLLSDPVMTSRTMLFVAAARWPEQSKKIETQSGMRLGVATGLKFASDIGGPIWDTNERVPYATVDQVILALLDGEIDAGILEEGIMLGRARELGLDARFYAVGQPLLQTTRHIAIGFHQEKWLAPINRALAEIEASGELAALRLRFNLQLTATEVPPEVLTYGVGHIPPFQIVKEDGSVTGFSVEVMRELARRAGLDVHFEVVSMPDYGAGPEPGKFDMTILALNDKRKRQFVYTQPTGRIEFHGYGLANRRDELLGRDLQDLRIGVIRGSLAGQELTRREDLTTVIFDDVSSPIAALEDGEIDVAAYPTFLIDTVLAGRKGRSDFAIIKPTLTEADRVVLLRNGLASVRERLNGVIPGFVISEEYRALERRFFGAPVYWTEDRKRLAKLAALALGAIAISGFVVQNWTSRRRWKRQAEQTRLISRRFETVLETARSGIVGLTETGQIALANPSARAMLGLGDTPLPTTRPSSVRILDPKTLTQVRPVYDPFTRAAFGQRLVSENWAISTSDADRPIYVMIDSAVIPNQVEGVDFHTVVLIDDISTEVLNRQQADRANRLDALGQLTGGIAHDFNNLLTTIKCSAELAREEVDPKGRAQLLDAIEAAVKTGSDTTSRLLAFAKPLPGREKTAPVQEVLDDLIKMARPGIESSITLNAECRDPGLEVHCDISQLKNALLNLILNARDVIVQSAKGNEILVSIHGDSRSGTVKAVFEVTDNSIGMSEEVRRRATDPFFTTKQRRTNSGLGLSMVYGFVQQSKGSMAIESTLGQGTTVQILLPAAYKLGEAPAASDTTPQIKGRGQVILVVEDNESLLALTGRKLEMLGYVPRLAKSGDEALDILNSGARVDLLLTDVMMPGKLGGFALANAARQLYSDLPVIYMSGYSGLTENSMGDVADPILQKPFSADRLAHGVATALGQDAAVITLRAHG